MSYIENPKLKDSGILACIPQKGKCPVGCSDCFFQSGRSYLEPLEENLPNIPTQEMAKGKIVRMNDGNDSSNQRDLVEKTAQQFDDYFFNTSIPHGLEKFSAPVVLTLNPNKMTDTSFHKLESIPKNLMFVRIRVNTWNIEDVVVPAIRYYTPKNVMCVLTFMSYYTNSISENQKKYYEWKKRTINSYWCLKQFEVETFLDMFKNNPYVDVCTKKVYACRFCGVCLRDYYATKLRMVDK